MRQKKRPILTGSTFWAAASGLLVGVGAFAIYERHTTAPSWRAVRIGLQLLLAVAMCVYAAYRLRREDENDD